MQVRAIDPREGIGWGDEHPVFRATFWHRPQPPSGVRQDQMGYFAREFEISGADVEQVLAWARGQLQREERWTLHLLVRCPGGDAGEILLVGADPTT